MRGTQGGAWVVHSGTEGWSDLAVGTAVLAEPVIAARPASPHAKVPQCQELHPPLNDSDVSISVNPCQFIDSPARTCSLRAVGRSQENMVRKV